MVSNYPAVRNALHSIRPMHPALRGFGADTVVEPSAACDCVQKDALYVVGALVLLGILGTAAFVGTRA